MALRKYQIACYYDKIRRHFITALTDGQIIVGDTDDAPQGRSISGDATLDKTGVLTLSALAGFLAASTTGRARMAADFFNAATVLAKFADNCWTAANVLAKFADGAITTAKLAVAAMGKIASYTKATSTGAKTLLAANDSDRIVLLRVVCDETFAAGDGAAPVFKIGETETIEKFITGAAIGALSAGQTILATGTLAATKALLVDDTIATGTGAGGITVTAIVLPVAP